MVKSKIVLGAFVLCCSMVSLGQAPSLPPAKTPGDALSGLLYIVEGEFVGAADAMPEDKYSFAPTNGALECVRTFVEQVQHVAAVKYAFGSAARGCKPAVDR